MAGTQYTNSNYWVCPTENDVNGGTPGTGRVPQETTFGKILGRLGMGRNSILDGFQLPGSGTGITNYTTNGEAIIEGYHVSRLSGNFTISYYDDSNNQVYLRLLKSADKVTQVVIEVRNDTTKPANALHLGNVITASGAISETWAGRSQGRAVWGAVRHKTNDKTYVFNGGSSDWQVTVSGNTVTITWDTAFYAAPTELVGGWSAPTTTSMNRTAATDTTYWFMVLG